MKGKYEVCSFASKKIVKVEIDYETKHYIKRTGDNRRSNKINAYGGYFDTFAEAREHLIEMATDRLHLARGTFINAKAFMREVVMLEEEQ